MTLRGFASVALAIVWISACHVSAQSPAAFPDVLYLRFNEGAGATTADFAAPGLGSSPTWTSATWLPTSPNGTPSLSLSTNFGVDCFNSSAITLTEATFEAWVTLPVSGQAIQIFAYACPASPVGLAPGLRLVNNGSTYCLQFPGGTLPNICFALGVSPPPGTWVHVAVAYFGTPGAGFVFVYADQAIAAIFPYSTNWGPITIPAGTLSVAGYSPVCVGSTNLGGSIDEARIWSYGRTHAEILANLYTELDVAPDRITITGSGVPLVLNPATGTFSATGIVASASSTGVDQSSGFSQPLIGATVSVIGSFTGSDVSALTDVTMSPVTTRITVLPGADELVVIAGHDGGSGVPPRYEFTGATGTARRLRTVMGQSGPSLLGRIGGGAAVLDALNSSWASGETLDLEVVIQNGAPFLTALLKNFSPAPILPQSRIFTNGAGSFELAVIQTAPSAQLFNIFDVNPGTPAVGTGPLLGISLGLFQWNQLGLPFGTAPFKVAADVFGGYAFNVAAVSSPPGTILDEITVVAPLGGTAPISVLAVNRIGF